MTDGVLVVGEALVDIVKRQDGSTETFPGGSAANVAVALARHGRDAGFVTSFADDEHGRLIAEHLAASRPSRARATATFAALPPGNVSVEPSCRFTMSTRASPTTSTPSVMKCV